MATKTEIHIRLSLHTQYGPVGPRLERGTPLPATETVFPDTEAGRLDAEQAREKWQAYCDRQEQRKSKR